MSLTLDNYELIRQDPASLSAFNARYKKAIELLIADNSVKEKAYNHDACPAFMDITALQLSIFDNRKSLSRKHQPKDGFQWGGSVKVYTDPVIKSWTQDVRWGCSISFWPAKEALKKAEKLMSPKLKHPISQATYEMVEAGVNSGYQFVAIPCLKNDGTVYFQESVVMADIEKDFPITVKFLCGDAAIVFEGGFSKKDPSGKDLTGNVIASFRHSEQDNLDIWATGRGTDLFSRDQISIKTGG